MLGHYWLQNLVRESKVDAKAFLGCIQNVQTYNRALKDNYDLCSRDQLYNFVLLSGAPEAYKIM